MELRSGYEIFLKNPRFTDPATISQYTFTFINVRDRFFAQRDVVGSLISRCIPGRSHIEEKYFIGEKIGSGMSGQVFLCVNRETKVQCAVKIIDTRKFSITPGIIFNFVTSSIS